MHDPARYEMLSWINAGRADLIAYYHTDVSPSDMLRDGMSETSNERMM